MTLFTPVQRRNLECNEGEKLPTRAFPFPSEKPTEAGSISIDYPRLPHTNETRLDSIIEKRTCNWCSRFISVVLVILRFVTFYLLPPDFEKSKSNRRPTWTKSANHQLVGIYAAATQYDDQELLALRML
ncbi:hypothetical protein GALMADRAFT_1241517 [Galerina marginata CBS 339.88]|uniref:Uncharacterized protein n=1 Tax=Galerina marginata (strain CBS 339.88) TaxID=685588 RepID=A0A067TAW2_GALM3|nr:hypothetical protein GALMADRAFT_1241517 [Galerina marginata CBS 339.88]